MSRPSPPSGTTEGLYFYLSRAREDRDRQRPDPDYWINLVFDDLCAAVERERRKHAGWRTGYLDPCRTADDDDVCRALASAEVFVALFSERYAREDRAMSQLREFGQRFAPEPEASDPHVLPVLWESPPSYWVPGHQEHPPAIARLMRDYTRVGLSGLRRNSSYRAVYEQFMTLIGRRIADVAEGSPVATWLHPVPDFSHDPSARHAFVVAVLALRLSDRPNSRATDRYGDRPVDWRPFGPQASPVAGGVAARSQAHRPARIVD